MMKCDNCIRNGICQMKAQFLKMHPLGKIGYCYAFIEKDSKPKPKSNGDRIRAMTDEEFATWFDNASERCFCCNTDFPDERAHCPIRPDNARACDKTDIVAWLKQPVKEDE